MKNYGDGKTSDLEQTALGMITTGFKPEDLDIPRKDREILRNIAGLVKEISEQDSKRRSFENLQFINKKY